MIKWLKTVGTTVNYSPKPTPSLTKRAKHLFETLISILTIFNYLIKREERGGFFKNKKIITLILDK